MKIQWTKSLRSHPRLILEEAGYHRFVDPRTQQQSFVMRFGQEYYPRYHVYVKEETQRVTVDLHVDQKKASYEGQRAHSGEYDGPLVEEEIARLTRWLTYYSS